MIEIIGDRLILRTMTREEYHRSRRAYISDPMMDSMPYHYSAPMVDRAFDRMLEFQDTYPHVGIFLKEGEIIGLLSFKRINRERRCCELGIALNADSYKERGYGTEAFALAVHYAFDSLDLLTVFADTMGSNIRMQRILSRLGFRCFRRMEEAYDMLDRWEDRLDYILTRDEYLAQADTPSCAD